MKDLPRFIADCHLGKLARYLRILGVDTLYFPKIDDTALIHKANKEDRIILTRDRELYLRKQAKCYYLQPVHLVQQLKELIAAYHINDYPNLFSRCILCNTLLVSIKKTDLTDKIPPKVLDHFSDFTRCPVCNKIYWEGSHYQRMRDFVKEILKQSDAPNL